MCCGYGAMLRSLKDIFWPPLSDSSDIGGDQSSYEQLVNVKDLL